MGVLQNKKRHAETEGKAAKREGELNIIVGVDTADYETAIRALYGAFFA